jgi:ribosomal protein L29
VKAEDIRELSDDEIAARPQGAAKEELFRLRFRSATQELENPALLKATAA